MEHGVFVREFIGLSLHLDVDFEAVDFKIMKVNRKLAVSASLLYLDNADTMNEMPNELTGAFGGQPAPRETNQ